MARSSSQVPDISRLRSARRSATVRSTSRSVSGTRSTSTKRGRRRQTLSYGKFPNLNLSPRQALAREIWDVRCIYYNQGLYSSKIRQALQELIKLNKSTWLSLFKKGVIEP